jgi:hypothetical protein
MKLRPQSRAVVSQFTPGASKQQRFPTAVLLLHDSMAEPGQLDALLTGNWVDCDLTTTKVKARATNALESRDGMGDERKVQFAVVFCCCQNF